MPLIFHRPLDRRSFLKTTTLGGAALVVAGYRAVDASAAEPGECHFGLLSDTHIPANRAEEYRGFKPWENLRAVVPQVAAARPQGVVICGDAARLEGRVEDYQELRGLLEPLANVAPVYIGLGNHDDRANFLKVFEKPPGPPAAIDGKHVTVIEHPVVRLIVLDSLLYANKVPGHLGRAQREWLARYLPDSHDRPAVLFVHHTLGDGDGDLLDADRLFALLRSHRHVKAIVYGHSHVWECSARQDLQLINLPAAGYNFRDRDPVGWVEARFRADGVTLTLHANAGQRADDGKTTVLSWL